jgi:L-ascorbate metabolism protein UlaG (beta-lactamase superfamily)
VPPHDVTQPASVTVTWIGHATALIELDGHRILTDPLLTKRVAHLRRRRPLPSPDHFDVDLILLSHVHLDHLHSPSLGLLRRTATVIAPAGSARLVRRAGFTDVIEVRPNQRVEHGRLTVEVVRAQHRHGRGPHSRVTAQPVGYVVSASGRRVYFPGDTDLFAEMADLHDIDVAMLPIWGWGSTLGEGHLNPHRAAVATDLIRPRVLVPIHWGTYAPEDGRRRLPTWFDTPPSELRRELDLVGQSHRLHLIDPGGALTVDAP